ncbi:MAG: thioredoxin-dependent thiol peroxidase [Deltaproteobacteria bacterium]|nr:thioredoxin-dependent thiol peroxidase [Deltaproteobacteria bacterium]
MALLEEGKKAPAFTLASTSGKNISSKDLLGSSYILFFYPKDNTPGCTKEACSFRDHFSKLKRKKIALFGISPDSIASHEKFISKQELPFELLSDPEHNIAEKFGAWGEKKMYGKSYMGILRSTFIVNDKGIIVKVYPKVQVATHAEDILEDLKDIKL